MGFNDSSTHGSGTSKLPIIKQEDNASLTEMLEYRNKHQHHHTHTQLQQNNNHGSALTTNSTTRSSRKRSLSPDNDNNNNNSQQSSSQQVAKERTNEKTKRLRTENLNLKAQVESSTNTIFNLQNELLSQMKYQLQYKDDEIENLRAENQKLKQESLSLPEKSIERIKII